MSTRPILTTAIALSAVMLVTGLAHAQLPVQNPAVDYTKPNYAYSQPMHKFVDSLPGLGAANQNNLGMYIPVAAKDVSTYPGCDYYQLGVVQYKQRMHSDLPAAGTTLRGYKDLSAQAEGGGSPRYLGPIIIARRGTPVRVKFTNMIAPNSSFFMPVDTTVMGAGLGPLGAPGGNYSVNRAELHLHGGFTPWISDGTPHQWVTPSGETTPYTTGLSLQNVPDMPDPGAGSTTYYYTNDQSSRLMFYHDHSYGITRLNVYAGEAAPYLLTDPVEEGLITSGVLPSEPGNHRYGVPLIIQDKTFVSTDPARGTAVTDPLWPAAVPGAVAGDLWFPHIYQPNQNPDGSFNMMGRWDYGPWVWPPALVTQNMLPTLSVVPEAFMDTPLVNGVAYPYMTVQRKAYRFRILNACNDRFLNLQLYLADATGTEVAMVAAPDGRNGGVPDAAKVGPAMIQIGSEGGLLPAPVTLNVPAAGSPIYVDYDTDRRSMTYGNVLHKNLFLGPAERADIIIDFSQLPAGAKLVLYNDAPAPVPSFDPRYDFYTGDVDETPAGGAPTTVAGMGPNTRTIMQFRVDGTTAAAARYNVAALQTALPTAFAQSQPLPHVPPNMYASVRLNTGDTFAGLPVFLKTIAEDFDTTYGRMNARLGTEQSSLNSQGQQTFGFNYTDMPTEIVPEGQTQIWSIVHNGVDTHAIHFHLVNVQVINRVDWAGVVKPPDINELGWKETIRANPLENVIVAIRPIKPTTPFTVPNSVRPLDVTMPATDMNPPHDLGHEYVWHCHLLGHEENDMMRPLLIANQIPVVPIRPSNLLVVVSGPTQVTLTWTDNSSNETGFRIERSTGARAFAPVGNVAANVTTYADATVAAGTTYSYRVIASNALGDSPPSNTAAVTIAPPAAPTSLTAVASTLAATPPTITLTWVDNSNGETGFLIRRATNSTFTAGLATFTVGANIVTYTDTAAPKTKYYYQVQAYNGAGSSAFSNTVNATTAGQLPAAPTNLTSTSVNTRSIGLSWIDNANNESGFRLERSSNGSSWSSVASFPPRTAAAPVTCIYTATGLKANTTYYFRVQEYNVDGTVYSNVISVKTLP